MLLAELVATSAAVAATRARSEKVRALADLLRRLDPDEVEPAVAALAGAPRQGKIGIGWASLGGLVDVAPAAEPSLTVGEVDAALHALDGLRGSGSVGARTALLRDVLARATAEEADFLRRLLLGELRQGALAGIALDAVAKAADVPLPVVRRAAMFAGDLPLVARVALAEGAAGLAAIELEPLRPVLPMLAAAAPDVAAALALTGRASVEEKLDGARVQVHRLGDEVRCFTRNLNDVTDRLPGVVALARSLPATSVVLDGEVLGLAEEGGPEAFQDSMSRFGRQDGGGDPAGLDVRFFDCLFLDGEPLVDRPLAERLDALERVAGRWRVRGAVTDDPAEGQQVLDEALASGHEGVVVKDVTSTYDAGRRGGAWRKVKPVHTYDLVVLAVEWGSGRRRGWLSNLHLGARDGDRFVMVGKTFKGLTDELLAWQTSRLLELETSRQGHVVHVRPELVVEIALDGVQASTRYPGGIALRFARVRRYRPEKRPLEADTLDALRGLLPRGG